MLATPATVVSAYVDGLIAEFASDCQVIRVGAPALVELAELRVRGEPVDSALVAAAIAPLVTGDAGGRLDAVVLGCTHFPLLRAELAEVLPQRVKLIDSEEAIARRVASLTAGVGD